MATLEQLLKEKGFTAQEMEDLKPMLSNAKFRSTLESELTNGEKALKDLDEYDRWFSNEITPEHQRLLKEREDALVKAAAAEARFEAQRTASMRRQAGDQDPAAAAAAAEEARVKAEAAAKAAGLDPSKFVTAETFQKTYEKTGDAIATAINITTQHMQLFPGSNLDMEELLSKARAAKKPVRQYWEDTYKVSDKRAEIEQTKRQKEIDDAVKKREQELMVQFAGSNPNLKPMSASNSPFVARKKADTGKQPWEKNDNELTKDRIERAITKAAGRGELAPA